MIRKEYTAERKAQADFERGQRRQRIARIVKVASDNPDLPLALLGERFGMTDSGISSILHEAGVKREEDRLEFKESRRANAPAGFFGQRTR